MNCDGKRVESSSITNDDDLRFDLLLMMTDGGPVSLETGEEIAVLLILLVHFSSSARHATSN